MRAQRLEAIAVTVSLPPTQPDHLVRKDYVDALVSNAPVFITDVTPQSTGIVGLKEYEAGTVPANVLIDAAVSDTQNIRVHFLAEAPADTYNPTLTATVNGGAPVNVASMTQTGANTRMFTGYFNLTITTDSEIVVTSSSGATDTVNVVYGADGPELVSFTLGALPGSQTEVKQGDSVPFTGTAPNSAVSATVSNAGAAQSGSVTLGAADSAGAGFKTVTGNIIVANRSGLQNATIVAQNSLGTSGDPVLSTNQITLNQTFPSIGAISISYPAGQTALKASETADVSSTITNADTVVYSSSADLSVTDPTVYNATKTVTRIGGSYVRNTNNYTITATRAANGAVSTANAAVTIANVAPTAAITIVGAPARLRSSAAGQDYEVRITPNQVLASAPSLDASSGNWQGSWTLNGSYWFRTLRIADADVKGAQTFNTLNLPSLSDLDGSTISSGAAYTVGGFVLRQVQFAAFSQYEPIGTQVVDIAKTVARYVGVETDLTLRADTNNVTQSYTITNSSGVYDATGDHIFINDVDFANSNTSGTLLVEIEETV